MPKMRLPVLLRTLRDHGVTRYRAGDVEIELGEAPEKPAQAPRGKAVDMHVPGAREKPPDALSTVLADKFPPIAGEDPDDTEAN